MHSLPATRLHLFAVLLSLVTGCAWSNSAAARDSYDLTLFSGYRLGGMLKDDATNETLDISDAVSFGVSLAVPYDAQGQLEFLWTHSAQALKPKELFAGAPRFDVDVDYFQLGGIHTLEGEHVRPFVVGSLGATRLVPKQSGLDAATEFSVSLGGGAKWWITRHFGMRFEGRGYLTLLDSNGALFCGENGCVARFSGSGFAQFEINAGVFASF